MSGGIAYILDVDGDFAANCNMGMVELEAIETDEEAEQVRALISEHVERTQSSVGQRVLDEWPAMSASFVKVMPEDYKRVLLERSASNDTEAEAAAAA